MKRLLLAISIFLAFAISSKASHIIGGEMRYEYVGPGVAPNSKIFKIILILFKGDATGPTVAPLDATYVFGIYNNDNGAKFPGTAINSNWTIFQDNPPGILTVPIVLPACIENPPTLNYTYATYSTQVELPNTNTGYTIVYQNCCRMSGLINVANSTGATYTCIVPGTNQIGNAGDDSPAFGIPINVICKLSPFTLNFSATDANPGDSLVYSLCNAYNGGAAIGSPFENPAPPPYGSANYNAPYSGGSPFNTNATINPQTGIISGTSPDLGNYVVCVCIDVYRNGVLITTHRKDLIVRVSDCTITKASTNFASVTCDGFNVTFTENSTGATTYFWDFGDPTTLADTSHLQNPPYDYSIVGAGTYNVKLVINRGTSCADSITKPLGVFPGFFPGFRITGACYLNPFQFIDTSRTNYGFVDTWSWNFGDPTTLADTSHLQNPTWTYSTPGPKTVTLSVTNSKGCINTATVTIDALDKPILGLGFRDTLICITDAVTLNATGTGVFNWTPPINITNANTPNPTVNPNSSTWYYVNLTDNGCANRDSVHVRVVPGVSLLVRPDTTICLGDAVQLNALTDGLSFQWTPAATLNNASIVNPMATPVDPVTTYQLTATIGSCSASDDVTVRTVPYPVANAGPDQTICYNTSAQLNGSHDGTTFNWSPTSYLNNPNILNPVATPPRTTTYVLTAFDNRGCPKPGRDTIIVKVNPKVIANAGHDTTVVVGQPLHLFATGGVSYVWSPTTGFTTSNTIQNPIAIYGPNIDSVRYKVVVTDNIGCPDSAWVTVRIFKTVPSVFVPTAFTPNGDGLNDRVYPIAVGMRRILYFSIYNRWGELVFTTTENNRVGWDGRIKGELQSSNVFVWMVRAEDYLGNNYFQKGTVTLIR